MINEDIYKIREILISDVAKRLKIEIVRKKAFCYNGHDKDPSLSFDDKKGYFKCFGCGEKGDQITLVMKVLEISFKDALNWFEQEFQVGRPTSGGYKMKFKKSNPKVKLENEKQYLPNPKIYESLINKLSLSDKAIEYLISRGFSREIIAKLEIRDIPNPNVFFESFRAEWGVDQLIMCGLCKVDESKIKNIWWDHVIIFPFTDLNGRITYLQGRRMNLDKINIKHINLAKLSPFPYNLNIISQIKFGDDVYLCEGISDTITAIHFNLNAIGILGANNFNDQLLPILQNYRIFVIPDRDRGGDSFLQSVREAFLTIGKTVQQIKIPTIYNDLNEFFNKKDS